MPRSYHPRSIKAADILWCYGTTGFPAKWLLRNERRNSILMTYHYPDLGSASDWLCREGKLLQPIKSRLTFDCFLWPSRAKSVYQYVMLIRLSYCLWSVIAALNFFNPLGPKSDQRQFSPNNISRSSRVKVMRITKLITKGRTLWS